MRSFDSEYDSDLIIGIGKRISLRLKPFLMIGLRIVRNKKPALWGG